VEGGPHVSVLNGCRQRLKDSMHSFLLPAGKLYLCRRVIQTRQERVRPPQAGGIHALDRSAPGSFQRLLSRVPAPEPQQRLALYKQQLRDRLLRPGTAHLLIEVRDNPERSLRINSLQVQLRPL
jgi:hypothetical protein